MFNGHYYSNSCGTQAAINSLALLTIHQKGLLAVAKETVTERVLVYKITCISDGRVYVGITAKTVEIRWLQHIQHGLSGRLNTPLYDAIREYGASGFRVECIGEAPTRKEAGLIEKQFIAEFECLDPKGFNRTTGGEPSSRWSEAARKKASESKKGIPWTDEKRASMAVIQATDDYRAKMRAASAKRGPIKHTYESKQKLSNATLRYFELPENRAKHSRQAKERMADPERRRKLSEKARENAWKPENRAKWEQAFYPAMADPELKERHRANTTERMKDPAIRKKISDAVKRRHAEGAYKPGWNQVRKTDTGAK